MGRNGTRTAEEATLVIQQMCDVIEHRGPDDEGYHVEAGLALGMRRLSIIDLSTGRQPISNEDGTIWIVFNGEIYNHRQLRQELIQRGHTFRTCSDTEVIVHLYEDERERSGHNADHRPIATGGAGGFMGRPEPVRAASGSRTVKVLPRLIPSLDASMLPE